MKTLTLHKGSDGTFWKTVPSKPLEFMDRIKLCDEVIRFLFPQIPQHGKILLKVSPKKIRGYLYVKLFYTFIWSWDVKRNSDGSLNKWADAFTHHDWPNTFAHDEILTTDFLQSLFKTKNLPQEVEVWITIKPLGK